MGNVKNSPFALWTNLFPHLCVMKIPQYTKYSGISITVSAKKSSSQSIKKEFFNDCLRKNDNSLL